MKILSALLLIVFASCNSESNKTSTIGSSDTPSTGEIIEPAHSSIDISGCYIQVISRDTIFINVKQDGATVTGQLMFDNFEKDSSSGSVKGTIENNIIKLLYSFTSEGMNSVMEIYLKVEDDKLVRGIGEMATKGDTAYFTQPGSITYPTNTVLTKTNCK